MPPIRDLFVYRQHDVWKAMFSYTSRDGPLKQWNNGREKFKICIMNNFKGILLNIEVVNFNFDSCDFWQESYNMIVFEILEYCAF